MGLQICWPKEDQEVKEILKNHALWLASDRKDGIRADLSGIDLENAELNNLDLTGAVFRKCTWGGANYEREDLHICSFENANLSGSCLAGADLTGISFVGANLQKTDLRSSNLNKTDFSLADLTNANLDDCNINMASFRKSILVNTTMMSIDASKLGDWDDVYLENLKIDKNLFVKFSYEFIEKNSEKFKYDRSNFSTLEPYGLSKNISFPPEYQQAGIAILNYFHSVLSSKLPNNNVDIIISQKGNKVTLRIAPPIGSKEFVRVTFEDYIAVVCGTKSPDDFFDNSLEKQKLQHKLDLAALEIRHTKELLQFERVQSGQRIAELSSDMDRLKDLFEKQVCLIENQSQNYQETINSIISKLHGQESTIELLLALNSLIEKGINTAEERKDAQGILDQINELIIKGSISGAAGNLATSLIISLSKLF